MEMSDWVLLQVLFNKKNITQAAQSLFISQPTLTKRLKQIEEEFGVLIVQRGTKGVYFTTQGEYLAKCAEEVLVKQREIKDYLLNINTKTICGTLSIAASHLFARYRLPKLLKSFKDIYPDIKYKIITAGSRQVHRMVNNREVLIGFVRGDISWSHQKYLLSEDTLWIVSKEEINLADLPHLPRINLQMDYSLTALSDEWWVENFSKPPLISIEVGGDTETCKEMVLHGLGYAILPSIALADVENSVLRKKIVDKNGQPMVRRTWMYFYDESLKLNSAKAFVDFVKGLSHSDNIY